MAEFRIARTLLLTTLPVAPTWGLDVHVVDASGATGSFVEIQDAIDAASDGDLVLVKDGSYSEFTVDETSVRVVADSDATPVLDSEASAEVRVVRLRVDQSFELHGLTVRGGTGFAFLHLGNNRGPVLVQDTTVAHDGVFPTDGPAVQLSLSDSVALVRTTVDVSAAEEGLARALAIDCTGSTLFAFDCEFRSGRARPGDVSPFAPPVPASDGAAGIRCGSSSTLLLVDCRVHAGPGGDGDHGQFLDQCVDGGAGGAAVEVVDFFPELNELFLVDASLVPGAGGSGAGACSGGPSGPDIANPGATVTTVNQVVRSLAATPVVREGEPFLIEAFGVPGDLAWLLFSTSPSAARLLPGTAAGLFPGVPVRSVALGVVGATGTKALSPTLSELGVDFAPLYLQALFFDASEGIVFSNPRFTALLDAAIP